MITLESLAQEALDRWHVDPDRMTKAVQIAGRPGNIYNQHCEPGGHDVRSQTGLNGWYHVNLPAHTCTCQDSQHGHVCKHRLAVWLRVELDKRRGSQAQSPRGGMGTALVQLAGNKIPLSELQILKDLGY